MTAHQRVIRDRFMASDPREIVSSLAGFSVEVISRDDALQIILHYEWLGTMGHATHFVGLLSRERVLFGVACFGHGPGGFSEKLLGGPAWCLERGACIHYAPRNAASFLINRACKLIYRITDIPIFYAYADPEAGEYGAVYQAAGWLYLGRGLQGHRGDRARRCKVLAPGLDPNVKTNWKTTRVLRQNRRLSFTEAQSLGWRIERNHEAKHVYATNVSRRRHNWLRQFPARSYPAPTPELKLKNG